MAFTPRVVATDEELRNRPHRSATGAPLCDYCRKPLDKVLARNTCPGEDCRHFVCDTCAENTSRALDLRPRCQSCHQIWRENFRMATEQNPELVAWRKGLKRDLADEPAVPPTARTWAPTLVDKPR